MTEQQKLVIRWSLVTSGLIAAFWVIYYLIAGEVPVITSNKMTRGGWNYILILDISRWWDIFLGPIWSTLIIFLLTNKKLTEEERGQCVYLGYILVFILALGLALGPVVGPVVSPVYVLIYGLVFLLGLFTGLLLAMLFGPVLCLVFVLVYSLVFGLGCSLVFVLVFGLGFVLVALGNLIPDSKFWHKVWNWLMVKETQNRSYHLK